MLVISQVLKDFKPRPLKLKGFYTSLTATLLKRLGSILPKNSGLIASFRILSYTLRKEAKEGQLRYLVRSELIGKR
jgi:hypothetical protein